MDHNSNRFYKAMDDDFNTPEAISVLFELAREINRSREVDEERAQSVAGQLKRLASVLGLLQRDPEEFLQQGSANAPATTDLNARQIELLIEQRNSARRNKDYAQADRIRDQLLQQGVILEDGAGGTSWRRE
jgi:cysteinyl-tRNA synthetase